MIKQNYIQAQGMNVGYFVEVCQNPIKAGELWYEFIQSENFGVPIMRLNFALKLKTTPV